MDYTVLQVIARSWGTLFLFAAFVGVFFVMLRPGHRNIHRDAADVPFRHEDRPAEDTDHG